MVERRGERCLLERRARLGRLAVEQERRREAGHVLEFGKLLGGEAGLAARDDRALARTGDRRREQIAKPQAPAKGAGRLQRQHPAGDRARHGERRERTARRDRFVVAVNLAPRIGAGVTGRHQRAHAPRRLAHEPKAVAAELGHVRIDRSDGRCHRDHGLERIAAFGERRASGLDRGVVRRGDDASAMPGGVKVHGQRSPDPALSSSAQAEHPVITMLAVCSARA